MFRSKKAYCLLLLMFPVASWGYEVSTHAALAREAYERSALKTTDLLNRLGVAKYASVNGLGDYYADMALDGSVAIRKNNPESSGDKNYTEIKFNAANKHLYESGVDTPSFHSPAGWLMVGAIREDDVKYDPGAEENPPQDDPQGSIDRVLNHFYDPYLDIPLLTNFGSKAPDWAIDGKDRLGRHRNHFSIKDAKEAMFRAATLRTLKNDRLETLPFPWAGIDASEVNRFSDVELRRAYWATVFRALGDVVHNLQDMGQPQHTRNDAHAEIKHFGYSVENI